MALSRQRKEDTVSDVRALLAGSKLTVFARYQGTAVKDMQSLRAQAKNSGTSIRVVKNRLFKKALEAVDQLKSADVSFLQGQLLYAFNGSDEVAPAQNLAGFAKFNPQLEFVGAITQDGQLLTAQDVQALADLPSKERLRGQLVGLISSPLSSLNSALVANVRGVLSVLNARAEQLSG